MGDSHALSPVPSQLVTKSLVIALAVGVVVAGTLVYLVRMPRGVEKKGTMQVTILSQEALLDMLRTIRQRHSLAYRALRLSARTKRRRHARNSEAYRQCVIQFNTKSRSLLREVSKTVLREHSLSDALVLASCAFYEGDEDIEDAKAKLGVVINDAKLPRELTLERAKDIFLYCRERSSALLEDSCSDLTVQTVAMEDELFEKYGHEMEEVEKAYERYKRDLHMLETQIKLSACRREADDDGAAM